MVSVPWLSENRATRTAWPVPMTVVSAGVSRIPDV